MARCVRCVKGRSGKPLVGLPTYAHTHSLFSIHVHIHTHPTQVWPGAYARGRAAAAMGWRPLGGLQVILHGGKKLRPPAPFMTALAKAGGGRVLSSFPAALKDADPRTTVLLSSAATCKADKATQAWVARGGVVLASELLLDFVSQEMVLDLGRYCLFGTPADAPALRSVLARCMRWTPPPSSSE